MSDYAERKRRLLGAAPGGAVTSDYAERKARLLTPTTPDGTPYRGVSLMTEEKGWEPEPTAPAQPVARADAGATPTYATTPEQRTASFLEVEGLEPKRQAAAVIHEARRVYEERKGEEYGPARTLGRPPQTVEEAEQFLDLVEKQDRFHYEQQSGARLYARNLAREAIKGATFQQVDPASMASAEERRNLDRSQGEQGFWGRVGQSGANLIGALGPIGLLGKGAQLARIPGAIQTPAALATYTAASGGGPQEVAESAILGAVPNPLAKAGLIPRTLGGAGSFVTGETIGRAAVEGRMLTGEEAASAAILGGGMAAAHGRPKGERPRTLAGRIRALRRAAEGQERLPPEMVGELKAEAMEKGVAERSEVITPEREAEAVRAADEAAAAGLTPVEQAEAARVAVDAMPATDGPGGRQEGYRAPAEVLADSAVPEAQKAAIREAQAQGAVPFSSGVDPTTGKGVAIAAQAETGEVRRVEVEAAPPAEAVTERALPEKSPAAPEAPPADVARQAEADIAPPAPTPETFGQKVTKARKPKAKPPEQAPTTAPVTTETRSAEERYAAIREAERELSYAEAQPESSIREAGIQEAENKVRLLKEEADLYDAPDTKVRGKAMRTAGMVRNLMDRGGRFFWLKTAHEQGVYTDGRVLFRLNDAEKAAVAKAIPAEGFGETQGVHPDAINDLLNHSKANLPLTKIGARRILVETGRRKAGGEPATEPLATYLYQDSEGNRVALNADLAETILDRYPGADLRWGGDVRRPVVFFHGGSRVGVAMPINSVAPLRSEQAAPQAPAPETFGERVTLARKPKAVSRPSDQPPEAWLMGAVQANQREGMGPKEALDAAMRTWQEQAAMARPARKPKAAPDETKAQRLVGLTLQGDAGQITVEGHRTDSSGLVILTGKNAAGQPVERRLSSVDAATIRKAQQAKRSGQAGFANIGAIAESAASAARSAIDTVRNVFGAEGQRATDVAGQVGQRMKRIGFDVEAKEKESAKRLFPFWRRVADAAKRRLAASWAMTYDVDPSGAFTRGPRLERASQGDIDAPPEAADMVASFRDLSEARWNEADRMGLLRNTPDGPQPYGTYERGQGGAVTLPRVFHPEGAEVMRQGPNNKDGTPNVAYQNLAAALKKLNPDMADLVDPYLAEEHATGQQRMVGSGEQRAQFEFTRYFPEIPAAVKDGAGRWVRILETDPLKVGRNIFERGARRIGALSVVGQDFPPFTAEPAREAQERLRLKAADERTRKVDPLDTMLSDELASMGAGVSRDSMSSLLHDLRAEYVKGGGDLASFEKWVRDLHGVNPHKQGLESVAAQRGWTAVNRLFALQKALWQSGGTAFRNLTEVAVLASRMGLRNTARGVAQTIFSKRARDRAMLNGLVRLDVARRNIDPNHPVDDFFDHLGRGVYEGFGSGLANRWMNEGATALATRSLLGPAMAGAPSAWARRRIETVLVNEGRLDRTTARRLAAGDATPAEYHAAIRRVTANLTSGGLRPGERAPFENRRWFQRITAFSRYPMSVIRDTGVQIGGGLRDIYRATEPGITAGERAARAAGGFGTILRMAAGRTAQGLASSALTAFFRHGTPGLDDWWERLKDDPAGEMGRAAVVSSLTGFVGQAALELAGDGGVSGAIGAVASLPRWAGDMISAITGTGAYEGLSIEETAEKVVRRAIPAARVLDTIAKTAGIRGDKKKIRQEIEAAKTAHYDKLFPGRRWGRFPAPRPRSELDKPAEERAGINAVYDAAMDQDFDAFFRGLDRLGIKDDEGRESLAKSLEGRRIITSIRKTQREAWLASLPERARRGLEMHDAVLDMFAAILKRQTRKATGAENRFRSAGGMGDNPSLADVIRRLSAAR